MSKFSPYLALHVLDFLTDPKVMAMPCLEQLLYARMLMASWISGPFPDSEKVILRLMGAQGLQGEMDDIAKGGYDVSAAIRRVLEAVWTLQDGVWSNPRLEREREKSAQILAGRSQSAQRANQARWRSSVTDPSRIRHGSVADPSRIPLEVEEEDKSTKGTPHLLHTVEVTGTPEVLSKPVDALRAPTPGEEPDGTPRSKKTRKPASGPLAEAIRGFDELAERFLGEKWAWTGRDARALASALKKAGGDVSRVLERAGRMFADPPDEWVAQNASPWLLDSRWTNLAARAHVDPMQRRRERRAQELERRIADAREREREAQQPKLGRPGSDPVARGGPALLEREHDAGGSLVRGPIPLRAVGPDGGRAALLDRGSGGPEPGEDQALLRHGGEGAGGLRALEA